MDPSLGEMFTSIVAGSELQLTGRPRVRSSDCLFRDFLQQQTLVFNTPKTNFVESISLRDVVATFDPDRPTYIMLDLSATLGLYNVFGDNSCVQVRYQRQLHSRRSL